MRDQSEVYCDIWVITLRSDRGGDAERRGGEGENVRWFLLERLSRDLWEVDGEKLQYSNTQCFYSHRQQL